MNHNGLPTHTAPDWRPPLAEIAARLKAHAEYCGLMGMPLMDIAKDCDYLLQLVEEFQIVDAETEAA